MNGAFETIEIMGDATHHDFERLVVIISTNFTLHKTSVWFGGFNSRTGQNSELQQVIVASGSFLTPQIFLRCFDFLIVLRVGDAFLIQLLRERLFIGCGVRMSFAPL